MKRFVKRVLVLLCVAVVLITGCSSGEKSSTVESTVSFTERESLLEFMTGGDVTILEFDFQKDIQGIVFWQDIWYKGECIRSELISAKEAAKVKYVCLNEITSLADDRKTIHSQWKVAIAGPKHKEPFELEPYNEFHREYEPEGIIDSWNYSGGAYLSNGEPVTLEVGQSYALVVQEFNLTGKGIHAVSNEKIMKEAEFLQTDDAVIVLRVDTYATKKEAEAAAAGWKTE